MSNIPKIIHYCWFGGKPLPPLAKKCIASWKKYLPDYDIKRWDESNYNVYINEYTSAAYKAKKYAFVSDYARFDILYKEGGIYFDTDVEVIRPMDDIIASGSFMGCENPIGEQVSINPGLGFGVVPKNKLLKDLLDYYTTLDFESCNRVSSPETIVTHTTYILRRYGLQNIDEVQEVDGIKIYPSDYFCPISIKDARLRISQNTRSIHHFDQSWQSPLRKYGRKMLLFIGGTRLKNLIKWVIYRK